MAAPSTAWLGRVSHAGTVTVRPRTSDSVTDAMNPANNAGDGAEMTTISPVAPAMMTAARTTRPTG
jgi:hypothetical protein